MNKEKKYKKAQLVFLLLLRFVIGWHVLYEGISKVMNPQWTSVNYLQDSQGVLLGFSNWILSNSSILSLVDLFNMWGLVIIGLCLILGLFFKPAAIVGSFLIFIYYLSAPPLVGYEYSLPSFGSNLIINMTLIEAIAIFVLALFPTSKVFGLDFFLSYFYRGTQIYDRK